MTPYTYRCSNCGADLERRYPMGEAPDSITCLDTTCDGIARRVFTPLAAPAFPGSHKATYR